MEVLVSNPAWVQVDELGLAFIVVILCASLVLFVMKTSADREQNYLGMITKFLPLIEGISNSIDNINANMTSIGTRLGSMETHQLDFMPRAECRILDAEYDGPRRRKNDPAEVSQEAVK
jgi:hypothetical protein